MIGLALVAWARGEKDRAREYAATSQSFAIEMNDPYSMQIYESFKIRLAFLSDEFTESPMEVSPTIIDSNKFWLETPSLTRAEYHVRKDTPADCRMAHRLIKEALQRLQAHHNTPQMTQFLALKAVALHCSGRKEEALQVLEKTLRTAEPLGFRRTFIDRGPHMAELLKVLLARRPHDTYLRRLLDGFDFVKATSETCYAVPQVAVSDKPNSERLSNREIDVLLLLAERLSNKEIAERFFVSPDTVKKHTINIYRKLGVNDRRQAVVTARTLGILPLK
jgi:LuxR family maltose regulon positive regulatory protein